jgi:hypothetical protein
MSTKTTNTINYDPSAKSIYDQGIKNASGIFQQWATNPYGNPFFSMNKAMLNNQALGMGQRNISTILSNARSSGMGAGSSGFLQSMLAQSARGTSGLQNQGLFQAMQQANQNQQFALGNLWNFQPLMTGSTQTKSGLGTWLPQVLGAAAMAAAAPFTGGASLMGMGSMIGGAGNNSGFSGGYLGAANPFHASGGYNFGSMTPTAMPPNPFAAQGGFPILG